MIKNLSYIFGSKTKAQEIMLLINNAKKVVRHGFYESELPRVQKFCHEQHLYVVRSKFKVLFADDELYSNKGIRIKESDPRLGMYLVYISANEEQAWLASYYEMMNNHRDLGKILGYPTCCVDFFCQNFSSKNPNLQGKATNMFTNITQRDKDAVLLSHFPCSSDCQQSMVLGKKYLDTLIKIDKSRAVELMEALKV